MPAPKAPTARSLMLTRLHFVEQDLKRIQAEYKDEESTTDEKLLQEIEDNYAELKIAYDKLKTRVNHDS